VAAGYRVNTSPQTNLIQLSSSVLKNTVEPILSKNLNGSNFWLRGAVCAMALMAFCGDPVRADEIADIYQRLQNDPRNVTLNLQYAQAAEKAGKLKWALPAYERALSADPGNRQAQSGIDRVMNRLRAEAGRS
jgi:hypothetical protein